MIQQEKEKMFLDLNSVLVKFWIEQGRPDKEVKIELLERMLNWYKKMGTVTLDKQSKEPVSEDLEKYASRAGFDYVDDIESKYPNHRWNDHDVEFAYRDGIIAGAEWQKEQMLKEAVEANGVICKLSDRVWISPVDEENFHQEVYDRFVVGQTVKIVIVPDKEEKK